MKTLAYYAENAQRFFNDTVDKPMDDLYAKFLPLLPTGGTLLDAGCGSGRDARRFSDEGFAVTAFDASPQMAKLASEYLGQEVSVMRFDDIRWEAAFDGVWACASLLHLPHAELGPTLERLGRALKPRGFLYASFKYGKGEYTKEGRHFTRLDETRTAALFDMLDALSLIALWRTEDVREERRGEFWLNLIAEKRDK
jgi:SAM-dependent methyltransferase